MSDFTSSSVGVSNYSPDSTSAFQIGSAGSTRRGLVIQNAATVSLLVKLGSAPFTSDFTFKLDPGGLYESPWPFYQGAIWARFTATGTGIVSVTDLS